MFVVKKILGHLLMPLPLGLGLLTVGLFLIATRRRIRGWGLLLLGWLVLVTAANRAVSNRLTASLENTYPAVPSLAVVLVAEAADTDPAVEANSELPPPPDLGPALLRDAAFVAVLGGGHGDAAALPAGQRLSDSARARLLEGLRIARALPDSWLVVCGPRIARHGERGVSHARALADAAVELGFDRNRIVEVDTPRDTAEEVAALALLAGSERVALVTSAWHLPRAMRLASDAGLDSFPCPADYLGGRESSTRALAYFTWDAEALADSTRAWREYLGLAWARLVAWWCD